MQKRAARRGARALAFLLCLLMVVTLLPVMGASAAGGGGNEITNPTYTGADSGLVLSKTLTEDTKGNYSLKLEAYATGDVTTTPDTVAPLDIVLVLDQSGSMGSGIKVYANELDKTKTYYRTSGTSSVGDPVTWNGSSWGYSTRIPVVGNQWITVTPKTSANDNSWNHTQLYETRLDALKTAVNTFVSTVKTNATTNNVDHRIAIVGFASESDFGDNTEVLSVSGTNSGSVGVKYNDKNYLTATKNAFQDTTTPASQTMLTDAINALAANGATRTDLGMKMAQDILNQDAKKDEEGRTKLVIMFTDGTPTDGSSYNSNVADAAISAAKTIKDSAKVYTIGIFDNANPTSLASNENKFMNYVSSNYPNAKSMNEAGTGGSHPTSADDDSYYLAASDSAGLNNVFSTIQGSITGSSKVNLTTEAVLKDVVSDKFTVPANVTLSAASYACTGKANDGSFTWRETASQTYTPVCDGQTVTVTGFDYKENYVAMLGDEPHGQKLVLTISGLIPKDSGEQVFSNTDASGVYDSETSETPVSRFPMPSTNIPVYTKVLDFSMAANIATNVLQTNSNLNGTYGTFDLSSNNLTYKLGNRVADGNLVFDGVDSVLFYGDYNDDGNDTATRWNKVNVIPANNVYFDDDLLNEQSTFTDSDQGYDAAVNNATYGVEQVDDKTSREFTFTGTGIDVYCTTEENSGWISAVLLNEDSTRAKDADGNNIKAIYMNNQYVSNPSLINVPTISIQNVPYGKYVLRIETMNNTNYKLDGVRIYNPANADAVAVGEASGVDVQAQFVNVRDTLLSATPKELTEGAVYVDADHTTNDISVYEKIGPKNEVYLDQNQKVGFQLTGVPEGAKVLVGLSAPENNGEATATVTYGDQATTVSVNSAIDMYYPVKVSSNGYVVIKNASNVLLSVTNVQITGGDGTSSTMVMSSPELMSYMADFDALEIVDTTPAPEVPTPETPNNTVSAIIHAIWAQVRDSIGKLFGRL